LAIASPEVFAQGSMALGTTVKPREREEFDVDLVCLVEADWALLSPVKLYDLVYDRLRQHATYAKMLVEKERCLRLEYAGQFHLDIIPACPAPTEGVPWGRLAIVIPDKERHEWIATNPRGFGEWFSSRAMPAQVERVAMSVKPLPANQESGSKTVLQRMVQLFKRRRDVHFNGGGSAPKSILLTTIDGMFYSGENSLCKGVNNVLDRLIEVGRSHAGSLPPKVVNPTDPDENLARHWREDRRHFEKFIEYVAVFREGMTRLATARGMEEVAAVLQELFDPKGTGVVNRAVEAYSRRFQRARRDGILRMEKTSGGLTVVAAAPRALPVAKTGFWGVE
jgi:hypothetical protein